MMEIKPGDVLYVAGEASVQFRRRPIVLRVIRVRTEWQTYHGWVWLDGYSLDRRGDAVERRRVFVQRAGLRRFVAPVLVGAGRGLLR